MSEPCAPCFVCDQPLTNVLDEATGNQPLDGLAFVSGGHYGSTAFDPMDGSWLELNICDACVMEYKDKFLHGKQYAPRPRPQPAPTYVPWSGESG